MSHGRNKYQSRENRAKVREVLMMEWDPIGVRNVPEAQDEYEKYVSEVYVMLMDQRASETAIGKYLFDITTGYMGITPRPELTERCQRTAATLIALRPQFETH
jgi:hypothetical protein